MGTATGHDRGVATDPSRPGLDGRRFAMVSSTASAVDPSSPTVFDYHESDGMIWGEYAGDTVRIGRFVGSRQGTRVSLRFTHVVAATGDVVGGAAESRIESHADGLRLVEDFRTADGDQVSVCSEVRVPAHSPPT